MLSVRYIVCNIGINKLVIVSRTSKGDFVPSVRYIVCNIGIKKLVIVSRTSKGDFVPSIRYMGESQNWSTMNLKTKIISMRVIHILLIKVQIDFHKPK